MFADARQGNDEAVNRLFSTLYQDLRKLAHARIRGGDPPTFVSTTALVHESYLRMMNRGQVGWNDRPHFLAYAARVMRSIIVDLVRERAAERRGGIQVELETEVSGRAHRPETEILTVHSELDKLAKLSERMAQVVEMRYFAGMTEEEIAIALNTTERTVRRDWEKARLILAAALK
jgi:RNA polymerase sigma factor (TIGR02999 family)